MVLELFDTRNEMKLIENVEEEQKNSWWNEEKLQTSRNKRMEG